MSDPFVDLPQNHFKVILADPPWGFKTWWSERSTKTPSPKRKFSYPSRATSPSYEVMQENDLNALPVSDLAADDCVLFLWICWPVLEWSLRLIHEWGFEYKTCGFAWIKANARQIELFEEEIQAHMTLGYWTRSNSEVCLLATRGKPKRRSGNVRQGIIEPRREHSRKPDCVYERIERLVEGPYIELFARSTRKNWTSWGLETGKFGEVV
ncbi:DNA methyltransferase [Patescibacteria group bacterium]|nr:DNA methyltransferase [Patescibacteria group bacterium]